MSLRQLAILVVLALPAGSVSLAGKSEQADPFDFDGVSRVVAIGDVHGSYDPLVELLRAAKLIDRDTHWIGGDAHLVLVGDVIDRNPADRPVLDLLRRLQDESLEAGGRVHVLLGNHEVMNLLRDLRYVAAGSHRAFLEFEKASVRRRACRMFLARHRKRKSRQELVEEFERRYPPGYFGRLAAFDLDGDYGAWLVEQPVAIRINGVLYVHGGLTETVAEMGLDGINDGIRRGLVEHLESRTELEEHGLVDRLMDYSDIIAKAAVLDRGIPRVAPGLRRAAIVVLQVLESPLFGGEGPLWYRGGSHEDERIERGRLETALELLRARAMVVAHSPSPDRSITSRFSEKLYRVDHGLSKGNDPLALILEDDSAKVLDARTSTLSVPVPGAPQGHAWTDEVVRPVGDDAVTEVLIEGRVASVRELGRGSTRPLLLELELDGYRLRAVFKSVQRGSQAGDQARDAVCDRYQHEVAAYLIDRRIELGLVPVTVLRRVDDTPGSAQEFIEDAVDQLSVEAYRLEPIAPDLLERQLAMARLFDVLIGNQDRGPTDILYAPGDGGIRLIDHSKAFCVATRVRREDIPEWVEPGLLRRIADLDREWLSSRLGELLDERQISALLERRDLLLRRLDLAVSGTGGAQP